ncbi:hypothetical protein DEU56DRAFT_839003 [Suillus clintonianus]|uniref:uncharacterized protein n=1 Tax=Suillus clintonianus TaxID=1904413 RepID=UPI001B86E9A1|nr:uncharacterized protein DEU56DRAFT_839003 [Suillus clintonianus]KAG2117714.1 hypothetical protein DEU56DRAFT_839003 [Suillus clintonianus]
MDDINSFFAEQEQRMNLPDEDVDEYVRARLEDFHRNRSHVINRVIDAQGHPRKVDARSGPFLTFDMEEITPEQQISDKELTRQLKRKSAEPEHPAQGKKPRLYEIPNVTTSGVAVQPSVFSRRDNAEHAANAIASNKSRSKGANRTPQLAAHQRGDNPIETTSSSLGPHTNCAPVDPSSTSRIQSHNDESSSDEHGAAKLPVVGSVSHITKPTVHHEGNGDTKDHDLPPARPIPHHSTARARKSRVTKSVARDAINQKPTNGSSPEARMPCSEHDEGASTENERLQSFAPEPGIPSPQSELLELSAMSTSNITSPRNSPLGASRRSSTSVSLSSDTEGIASSTRATVVKPSKVRKTVSSSRNKADISKQNKGKKTKEKPALVTPLEYAQKLQLNLDLAKKRKTDYLKGKKILYVGGDMQYASVQTRGRMDYIIKHGGTLVPSYDPSTVTHIVTDATTRPTLKALGLKSLKEIPDHIPTVTWSWVISGYGRSGHYKVKRDEEAHTITKGKAKATDDDESLLDYEFLHAAFPQRIDAGRSWQKRGQGKLAQAKGEVSASTNDLAGDFSRISSFTEDEDHQIKNQQGPAPKLVILPPAPLTFVPTGKASNTAHHNNNQSNHFHKPQSNAEDPLAEFYEKAKADRDQDRGLGQSESDESDDEEEFLKPAQVPRRGFTCDRKEPQQRECANQDIIDKLEELMELHKAKLGDEDRWRVYSYSKCIRALRNYPKKIKSFNEARSINGVGEKTARKVYASATKKTDDVEAINLFQGIYGVGRQIASMWYNNGCRTLDDVRVRKGAIKLSHVQEIGLRFYDDINDRMPRSEAEKIFNLIKPIALELDEHLYINIMGSFRRGKVTCGDIDVLVTRPTSDGMTHAGLLPELLARLHAAGILTEDLALPDDFSALELCYRGLCKLPEPDSKRRRIDILCVPWENRGAALLYYTFNRAMRMKANVLGYSLNQRGLYAGVVRDPRDRRVKVSAGNIVASETEEEIFKILGVPWQEPHERVRG